MAKIIPISGFPEWKPGLQVVQEKYLDVIRRHFRLNGYSPIETPSVERVEWLSAKGGGENEQEIYALRRLHGEPTDDANLALRFDLTVPYARYVAQHEHDLAFPFMRYAIGKVWRGERAQNGRFREFYQCDIDVVGNGSLSLDYDAQVPAIMYSIFREIDIGDVLIRINNRKVLQGYMQCLGVPAENHKALLTIVDKLEKVGPEEVARQAAELGLPEDSAHALISFLSTSVPLGAVEATLLQLSNDEGFKEGVRELAYVVAKMREFGVADNALVVDMSIARGLDYYTGMVYETGLVGRPEVGSVCSGGRYENLVENFSNKKFPGVGMSIGLTRLLSRLYEFGHVKDVQQSFAEVLIANMGQTQAKLATQTAIGLRKAGIACEQYMTATKLDKQIAYATKKGFSYLVIIGADEASKGVASVKDLRLREQRDVPLDQLANMFAS